LSGSAHPFLEGRKRERPRITPQTEEKGQKPLGITSDKITFLSEAK